MQLCYRGAKYQTANKYVDTTELGITARFLGQTYTLRQAKSQTPLHSELFKYRGITYQK